MIGSCSEVLPHHLDPYPRQAKTLRLFFLLAQAVFQPETEKRPKATHKLKVEIQTNPNVCISF
jgi:hypothetical protein